MKTYIKDIQEAVNSMIKLGRSKEDAKKIIVMTYGTEIANQIRY